MAACVACTALIWSESACSFSASSSPPRTLIILAQSDTRATVTPKTARNSRCSQDNKESASHCTLVVRNSARVSTTTQLASSQSNPLTGNKRAAVDGRIEDDKSNPLSLVEMLCVLNQPEHARGSRLVPARRSSHPFLRSELIQSSEHRVMKHSIFFGFVDSNLVEPVAHQITARRHGCRSPEIDQWHQCYENQCSSYRVPTGSDR